MLEDMDLEGLGPSPGATPQPSTVWSQGAHSHPPPPGRARAGSPDQDGHDPADDEGMFKVSSSTQAIAEGSMSGFEHLRCVIRTRLLSANSVHATRISIQCLSV